MNDSQTANSLTDTLFAPLAFVDSHGCSWRKPTPEVEGSGFDPLPGEGGL
jgi:hypothetical protein